MKRINNKACEGWKSVVLYAKSVFNLDNVLSLYILQCIYLTYTSIVGHIKASTYQGMNVLLIVEKIKSLFDMILHWSHSVILIIWIIDSLFLSWYFATMQTNLNHAWRFITFLFKKLIQFPALNILSSF